MGTSFVTGGSGFVGRALVRALLARGEHVRALARSRGAADTLRALGPVEVVDGDLDDRAALTRGATGAEVVYHSAATVTDWGDPAEFHRINVVGTENMLGAAQAGGARRFVHVSTEAVLADGRPIVRADETRPRTTRPVGLYPRTKGLAEEAVLRATTDTLSTVIMRPRLIWGPGDTSLLPQIVATVRAGKFAWMSGGHYLTSTCHVERSTMSSSRCTQPWRSLGSAGRRTSSQHASPTWRASSTRYHAVWRACSVDAARVVTRAARTLGKRRATVVTDTGRTRHEFMRDFQR